MAENYFKPLFEQLGLDETVLSVIQDVTNHLLQSFKEKIAVDAILIPEKRQRFKINPAKAEELSAEKPKHDKKTRDEMFKEHQKKTEETKEFTKKLIEERNERQKRHQERERELRLKTLQEIEDQRKRQEDLERKLEEEKQRRVQDAMLKSEIRKKQLDGVKEEITKANFSSKPLYKQMEDAYKQQVLMPQLEKHKAELAKKRILYHPLDPEELKEHSKRHEELKREQEYRRKKEKQQKIIEAQVNSVSSNLQSKFTVSILEAERKKREDLEKQKEEKLMYINKRLQYSKLVKEMFPPVVDEHKRFEPEVQKSSKVKLKTARSGENTRENSLEKKKIQVSDYKSDIGSVPRRIWKKNPMVPELSPKKEGVLVDYLGEKRKERETKPKELKPIHIDLQREIIDEEMDDAKVEKIKAKAETLDKQAKIQERLIGSMKNNGFKGIEVGDQVNDMIISSIRAKLALLDKFNSK